MRSIGTGSGGHGEFFFRGDTCCLVTENDARIWWGHVGLFRTHPCFGLNFLKLNPISIARLIMPPMLHGDAMEARWWMGFEGSYSQVKTFERLKVIADQLAILSNIKDVYDGRY